MNKKQLKYSIRIKELVDICPYKLLENEIKKEGSYYRITETEVPSIEDFKPHAYSRENEKKKRFVNIMNKYKKNPDRYRKELCLCFGISLFIDFNDIKQLKKRYRRIGNYVVKIFIIPDKHGKIYNTPRQFPSHCTWYPWEDINELELIEDIYNL